MNSLESQDLLVSLLSKYDDLLENCCFIYLGDDIEDIKQISKFNLKSPCLIFSDDPYFLSNARLYYSVFPYFSNEFKESDIK